MKKQMIVSFENNMKSGLIYESTHTKYFSPVGADLYICPSLKSIDESYKNNIKKTDRKNPTPTNNNATIKSNNHITCDNNLTI